MAMKAATAVFAVGIIPVAAGVYLGTSGLSGCRQASA
jgi:hypothetical protein